MKDQKKEMRKRPRISRVSSVVMLIAALTGGVVLSSGAEAARVPISGPRSTDAVNPVSLSARSTKDLAAWAGSRLTLDRQRRAGSLTIRPAVQPAAPAETAATTVPLGSKGTAAPAAPAAKAAAAAGTSALVLYDTVSPYGRLGELYAMATANLAGHFGTVTAKPVSAYTPGLVEQYTATVYLGSTYYGARSPTPCPPPSTGTPWPPAGPSPGSATTSGTWPTRSGSRSSGRSTAGTPPTRSTGRAAASATSPGSTTRASS
ncbi:hypothetical protein ACFQ2B_24230 [Streptomyces stramineus]